MRSGSLAGLLPGVALIVAACGEGDPVGAEILSPEFDFQVEAPKRLETKSLIDVRVTITKTRGVMFPITIVFEKSNVGEPFIREGAFVLFDPSERTASLRLAPRKDPRIRVTVTESSERALSVSKTIAIDVLDFP